jgi:hypothetical protein
MIILRVWTSFEASFSLSFPHHDQVVFRYRLQHNKVSALTERVFRIANKNTVGVRLVWYAWFSSSA